MAYRDKTALSCNFVRAIIPKRHLFILNLVQGPQYII